MKIGRRSEKVKESLLTKTIEKKNKRERKWSLLKFE